MGRVDRMRGREIMDIWEIKLQSDECQYCEPPLHLDDPYLCKHPGENWGKECAEGTCPACYGHSEESAT